MRVLIACEFSGRVRDAFIRRGHSAISVDWRDTASPGPHIKANVKTVLNDGWDMMIAFPPCTYLSNIGSSYHRNSPEQRHAIEFVQLLWSAPIPRIAIENPRGALNSKWRKPTQIIQPYHHGDPWTKLTCLWLKGLPNLRITNVVPVKGSWVDAVRDSRKREMTFPGIAAAMAEQWGANDSHP